MHFRDALSSSAMITVTVRAFARYADLLGCEEITLALPEGATVGDAVERVRTSLPNGGVLPERPLAAVNLEHVLADAPLADGDELALLPPLAGG
jgi:molybdopterin converting factor small subunit